MQVISMRSLFQWRIEDKLDGRGGEFDPEKFDMNEVNAALAAMR